MTASSEKAELRQHYRALRDAIPTDQRVQRSSAIARLLMTVERFEHAGSVFVYVSTGSEVATHQLISKLIEQDRTVLVPRMVGNQGQMHAVPIRSFADLSPGRLRVLEPIKGEPSSKTPDVTIVPGLAFTPAGERLGQGGGYYDRYLRQAPMTYKCGVCFVEQLADTLPAEQHDVALDQVLAV